jgi:hypothetical protein
MEISLKNETEVMSVVSLSMASSLKNETEATSIVSLFCGKIVKK